MKISLDWLSDFVTFTEKDPQEIARRITAGVAEVDEVEMQGALLSHCCVGKVLTITAHPNADKLRLCTVQTDLGVKKVVCGGTNLSEGMKVAFAHTGATVKWHGGETVTLEKAKIRGEESEGMICAGEELGIDHLYPATKEQGERAIVDLSDAMEKNVGKDLREVLGMNDVVLHIDNHAITHRADLFSHVGFARECVAIGIAKWNESGSSLPAGQAGTRGVSKKAPTFGKAAISFKCINDIKDLIPRYAACTLSIDGMGQTPDWMKKRLEATGWRSLNLPIDITNYVAMELGMPLHSFDADDFKGDVRMRTSKKGESITTLDGVKRALPDGAIVLSDDAGIFDLLGIMGGLRSSTKDTTKRIYLHAAIIDPVSIRKAIIATGHRTDASTVYEKGVPRVMAEQGLFRAIELFLKYIPGATITSKLESYGDDGKPKPINFSLESISKKLGTEVTEKQAKKILGDLGFTVKGSKTKMTATPPLWRLGDIRGEHDLVEEIGRVMGYNGIEPVLPEASIQPPDRDERLNRMRDTLKEDRYVELLPLSLLGPALLKKAGIDPSECVKIGNPIGEELSLMQPSVLPGLLEHAERNMLNVEERLKTFTVAKVFRDGGERLELGLLFASRRKEKIMKDPFLRAKSHIQHALGSIGYEAELALQSDLQPFVHPGRAAVLMIQGKKLGMIAELNPAVSKRFDLPHRAAFALLNLTDILKLTPKAKPAAAVAQFPAISYDITATLNQKDRSADLIQKIRSKHELLESVEIADLYSGDPLKDGQYNLTLRLTYRAKDRTLKEEEVQKIHEAILSGLGTR